MLFSSDVTVEVHPILVQFSDAYQDNYHFEWVGWAWEGRGETKRCNQQFWNGITLTINKIIHFAHQIYNSPTILHKKYFYFKFSRLWQPEIFSLMLKWNSLAVFTKQSWWLSLPDSQEQENRHPSLRVFDNYAHDGCKNSIVWWMGLRLIFGVIISSMRGRHDALIIHFKTPIKFVIPWYSWMPLTKGLKQHPAFKYFWVSLWRWCNLMKISITIRIAEIICQLDKAEVGHFNYTRAEAASGNICSPGCNQ